MTKTAFIGFKTAPTIKTQAQKVADDLGLNLSVLLNGFLKNLITTRRIEFTAYPKEEPSEYLIAALKEAEKDIQKGRASPAFSNAKNAIAWLNDKNRK
ncbi:MAG: type II toxin-antitoxin system RelB/DinJ family antitoxin [Candidatus Jacksonbacteria bacterium]